MNATMTNMELRFADYLFPNQIAEGDLIKIDGDFLTVESWIENKEGFNFVLTDDFGDQVEIFLFDDEKVEWYVFVDTE
jgi:hypothetical protein